MNNKAVSFLNLSILICYFVLVIFTPIIFTTVNSELFEVPKMIFVYLSAVIILILMHLKFVIQKKHTFPLNPVFISLVIFLLLQIASLLVSIDRFTSIFGYPTRLNGGLLSQFSYLIIFAGILINLKPEDAKKVLIAAVAAATFVSLWGIPAHFGYDPSCFVLTNHLNASCWQKDFDPTVRIFSTLGQPNWLASYLILILPISIAFMLSYRQKVPKLLFAITSIILFLAIIFTNSLSGALGTAVGLTTFIALIGQRLIGQNKKVLLILLVGLILLLFLFGTNIIGKQLSLFSRLKDAFKNTDLNFTSPTAQITTGGTQSSTIRLIVWSGAINIFRHYPLLGTGPETFAYSYYQFRPEAHNQTTEWNFFYNKAHNEFLNYLANNGALGFVSYLLFLLIAIITISRTGQRNPPEANSSVQTIYNSHKLNLVARSSVASLTGYLASIFFGFSTVTSQTVMFILLACSLTLLKKQNLKEIRFNFLNRYLTAITILLILFIGSYLLIFTLQLFFADLIYASAKNLDSNDPQSVLDFQNATDISPTKNPFYLSDAANEMALYSKVTVNQELKPNLIQEADALAKQSQLISPNNLITTRKNASTYLLLSAFDAKYTNDAQTTGQLIPKLAPTDPQSYFSLAKIETGIGQNNQAKESLNTALKLKPDYQDAQALLDQLNNSPTK